MGTLFIGQNTIFLPEIGSTNSYAMELLKNVNLSEGTVIYTTNQTQGRGQRGNVWITQPGLNLAASYIIKPGFLPMINIFYLYIISALAVHDVLTEILKPGQYDIKIKWPNDILVNNNKIAGILNENIIKEGKIQNCVIGIGININQTEFNELPFITSLKLLGINNMNAEQILIRLNEKLEKYYLKLKSLFSYSTDNNSTLLEAYYKHFYKLNQIQKFEIDGKHVYKTIKGIGPEGLLELMDEQGEIKYYDIKQVKWVS